MASEFERIARLQTLFGPPPRTVSLGIGDDAAILDLSAVEASHLVWTIDACVQGVHFAPSLLSWEDVGWRSLMAAASDLAAMAASPLGALCAIAAPATLADDDLYAIARGQAAAAAAISTAIVGGNLSRASEVSLSTTLIGACVKPATRAGARVGDLVVLDGDVGLAAAGLRLLRGGEAAGNAVQAWRRPVARIAQGLRLGAIACAMTDVSDGLAQDAGHIAKASGVRIELDADAIVGAELRAIAAEDSLALALGGGEDYALVAAVDRAIEGMRVIGRCVQGEGVWCGGERVDGAGFDHFKT
jgi:thiamine-monophosphate kinase